MSTDFGYLEEALNFLRPKPHPFELILLGPNNDGGYLVPDDLDGVAHCFSPGTQNRKGFEDALTTRFGITCHMADFASNEHEFETPLIPEMQTFVKKWIGPVADQNTLTLENWTAETLGQFSHEDGDLVLQMDIEGGEYGIIPFVSKELLQSFRIVIIELHGLTGLLDEHTFTTRIEPTLETLSERFTVVHAHPNNCCGVFTIPGTSFNMPKILELTLLRNDRFLDKRRNDARPTSLPHRRDIRWNVPMKPPIHLSKAWSGGFRSWDSRWRMFQDFLRYFLFWGWRRILPVSFLRSATIARKRLSTLWKFKIVRIQQKA